MAKKDDKDKKDFNDFDVWEWLLSKSLIVAALIIFGYAGLAFAVSMAFLLVFLRFYGR